MMTTRWRRAAPAGALLAVLLLAGACAGDGGEQTAAGAGDVPVSVDESDTVPTADSPKVLAEGFGAGPTPTAKPSPRRTASPKRKPPKETQLPPPAPKPAPASCKPKYKGTELSRSAVSTALGNAADIQYWPNSIPGFRVPLNLVKAVAWQESGWQSNIIACDGGVGLMQVMPDTAAFINQRFDQSYDINTPQDNAKLGANYLAWLTKYFGDVYFNSDYTLSTDGCGASDLCLINAVIAAYNVGFGAVDTDEGLVIPNPRYVANVRALMTDCECLAY